MDDPERDRKLYGSSFWWTLVVATVAYVGIVIAFLVL